MKKLLHLLKAKKMAALPLMALALAVMLPTAASASSTSNVIDFGSGGFTFSLADIMGTAWNFISQFNTYVVLILALIVVPTLVGFVIWLISHVPRFRKKAST